MIEYHFKFEEKPDGSFLIDYKTAATTLQPTEHEKTVAKVFINLLEKLGEDARSGNFRDISSNEN